MARQLAVGDEACVSRQIVGNIEPGYAVRIKGVDNRFNTNVRVVEGADMDGTDRVQVAEVCFPGQGRPHSRQKAWPTPGFEA